MAVNLSFVTHDEDFASRGDSNGRSMVKNVFGKVSDCQSVVMSHVICMRSCNYICSGG